MKYRQEKDAEEDMTVTNIGLHVEERWWPGRLLDAGGNELPLPHDIRAGERYIIEVDTRPANRQVKYNPAKDDPNRPRGFCLSYGKRGACACSQAPRPGRSRCIGSKACEEYRTR
jgi:hypothetical protein